MLSIVKTAALAAALATAASAVLAAPLKKVTLLQPVPAIDIRNAPWAVAHEMGWFAEAGLEVEVQVTKGASVLIQQLLNGTAQYGMPPPENVLVAYAKQAPLKFFFASTTRSPFPLAVAADGPIRTPADLKDKVIGLHSLTAVQYYTTQSILRSADLKLNADYRYVEVGAGPAALKALQSGQIAALSTNVLNYAGFENRGAKFRYITTPEVEPIFAWSLVARADYLEKNRAEAVAVARGFLKGKVYCRANPESCVKLYFKRFPAARSPGIDEAQATAEQVRILAMFNDYAPKTPDRPWGWYDPKAWQAVVDYMVAGGQLDRAVDPTGLYTNALLDEINAVDLKAVETTARSSQ